MHPSEYQWSLDLPDMMADLLLLKDSPIYARAGEVLTLINKKAAKLNYGTRTSAHWKQQGNKVSLSQLQQALAMPLVEVWLGLLHSPTPYQWDGQGEFYKEARDIWISDR